MSETFYFVGEYSEAGHEEKQAGVKGQRGYPVFSTYDKSNLKQKYTNAWFVFKQDAIEWAKFKNT